jgi:hypothetical protein
MRTLVLFAILGAFAATGAGAAEAPKIASGAAKPERHYRFARVEMPAEAWSDAFKPVFDKTLTFDKLESRLKKNKVGYTLSGACMIAADFPEVVRGRLETFVPGDNLLDRGPEFVVVLKIMGIYPSKEECKAALDRLSARPEPKP